ncbi:MAG: MFS transporter [Candidatus Limnocylindrales bacterium]
MLRLILGVGLTQVGFHLFVASLPLALHAAGQPDPLIGALMGVAALTQMVAAFVAGGLMDRFGGRLVMLGGASAFVVASALLATDVASADGSLVPLVAARILQGIGLAACMPAALSLVPGLAPAARLAPALAVVGVAANVSLAVSPPFSIVVLQASSIHVVAAIALVGVAAGAVLIWPLGRADQAARASAPPGSRTFHPAWRPAWAAPLAVSALFVAHWGVVTGYLPQRAETGGADVGLFFTADAIGVLIARVPAGMLIARLGSRALIVSGLAITIGGLALLLLPPTTPLLVLAGTGTGIGAALIVPPVTFELSRRSDDSDRGSAFALYAVSFAAGVAIGSIGVAPIFERIGFEAALSAGIASCILAAIVAMLDPRMSTQPALVAA